MIAEQSTRTIRMPMEQLIEARIPQQHRKFGVLGYSGSALALEQTHSYIRHYQKALQAGQGMIFTGKQNSCKTFLACYALRMLMIEGQTCFYATHQEYTNVFMGDRRLFDFPLNQILRETSFLVIDAIMHGNEVNEGNKKALASIVEVRNTEGLPTFYAMRCSFENAPDSFQRSYGKELYESLKDNNFVIRCIRDSQKSEKVRNIRIRGII